MKPIKLFLFVCNATVPVIIDAGINPARKPNSGVSKYPILPPPLKIGMKNIPIVKYAIAAINADRGPQSIAHNNREGSCQVVFRASRSGKILKVGNIMRDGIKAPIRIIINPISAPLKILRALTDHSQLISVLLNLKAKG